MPNHSKRLLKLFSSIDATAFASIMVVLVFVELIVGALAYNPHHGTSIDLPRVWHSVPMPGALREDVMQVSIARDVKIYFGSEQVIPCSMAERIQARLKDRDVERKVYIRADAQARFGAVKTVLDGARSAGILRVAFLVDQRRLNFID